MSNDISDLMNNISQMMNNGQMPENVKNILSSMTNGNNENFVNNSNNNCNNNIGNSSSNSYENSSNNNPINNNENNSNSNKKNTSHNSNNNIFGDIDINTILKIQKVMNSINNDKQNDSRTNLLMSLKPYLKETRKNKVDQYIQLMKMGKVFEIINPLGGDNKNV